MNLYLKIVICTFMLVSLTIYSSNFILVAEANGRTVPILELDEDPYSVEVRIFPATPRVGNFHLNLIVTDILSSDPISDLTVKVIAYPMESSSLIAAVGPVPAYATLLDPNAYESTLNIPEEGMWSFQVYITKADKAETIDFILEFKAITVDMSVIFLIISVVPIIATISWYLRRRYYGI
ncbi:MAG: hypothetical protein FI727_02460 [SAR202 cluster bacterium]|nr:hypothetical protein [SAR202 cluster bacterium]